MPRFDPTIPLEKIEEQIKILERIREYRLFQEKENRRKEREKEKENASIENTV